MQDLTKQEARLSAIRKIEELAKRDGKAADFNADMGLKDAAEASLERARFLVLAATYLKNLEEETK